MAFRAFSDGELDRLTDDELLTYIRDVRDAGESVELRRALGRLAFRHWGTLVSQALAKVPSADAEQVAGDALESAVRSAFDGESTGEFKSWLNTIIARRIADYHRKREGKPDEVPLFSESDADEDTWGEEPAVPFEGEAIDAQRAIDQAYDELNRDDHRQVVDEYIFNDRPAADVAAEIDGMTDANVHQIARRFRKRVREILSGGDTSP